MAEQLTPGVNGVVSGGVNGLNGVVNGVNGHSLVVVEGMNVDTPTPGAAESPMDSIVISSARLTEGDDSDQPPPAKRARKLSDAEQASFANVSIAPSLCHDGRTDVLYLLEVPASWPSTFDRGEYYCYLTKRPICNPDTSGRKKSDAQSSAVPIL